MTTAGTGGQHRARSLELYAGIVLLVVVLVITAFHSLLEPSSPAAGSLSSALLSPGQQGHLLGTDDLGRDMASRVIAGFPWSLGITALATLIAATVGTALGLLGGSENRFVRALAERVIDLGISFPYLVIAISILAVVGHGFLPLSITLGSVTWPLFARVTYAEAGNVAAREFVLAARLIGVRPITRMRRHVLPSIRSTFLVMVSFTFADLLLAEAGFSYLGLGAPLGTPTWGNMLAEGQAYLATDFWMILTPAAAIVLVVVTANLLGDGIAARTGVHRPGRLFSRAGHLTPLAEPPPGAPGTAA